MTDIPTITQEEAVEVREKVARAIDPGWWNWADRFFDASIPRDVEHREFQLTRADRAIIAALSPNMDHAVGGVRRETLIRAMYEAWPHTVTSQALNELTGLPYGATIPYGMAQRCGASFVALERYADGILALSATTPPVNQDAVREALEQIAANNWKDQSRARHVARSALATPPLDNTGLDAAKDVTYVLQHNPNCPSPYLVRLCGKGTIDMKPYAVTSDRFGFGKTFGEAYAAALASGDRA